MKSEERYAYGESNRRHPYGGSPEAAKNPVQVLHHEGGVFENGQQPQVHPHGKPDGPAAAARHGFPVHPSAEEVVHHGRSEHQKDEGHFSPGIEDDAENQQPEIAQPQAAKQAAAQNHRQEDK